jgi:hypothetical protein
MVRLNKRLLLHWCLLQNLQQWFCIIMMTGFDAQRFSMSCYLLPFLLDVVSCRMRPVKSSVTGSTAVGAGPAALTLSQRESCRKPWAGEALTGFHWWVPGAISAAAAAGACVSQLVSRRLSK